jgi:6-phosphogluconolactonase
VSGTAASAGAPVLFLHADTEAWEEAAEADIVFALERALAEHGEARLLLSGGSTPAPVYRQLAHAPIDWARISVGLVDERWLPATTTPATLAWCANPCWRKAPPARVSKP